MVLTLDKKGVWYSDPISAYECYVQQVRFCSYVGELQSLFVFVTYDIPAEPDIPPPKNLQLIRTILNAKPKLIPVTTVVLMVA